MKYYCLNNEELRLIRCTLFNDGRCCYSCKIEAECSERCPAPEFCKDKITLKELITKLL